VTHKRSEVSLQRRAAQKYILDTSYRDPIMAETVSRTDFHAVLDYLGKQFEMTLPGVSDVIKGEVLRDSRGHGSIPLAVTKQMVKVSSKKFPIMR